MELPVIGTVAHTISDPDDHREDDTEIYQTYEADWDIKASPKSGNADSTFTIGATSGSDVTVKVDDQDGSHKRVFKFHHSAVS